MNTVIPILQQHKRRGFTLVELLISVSIIAILIAIGIASYSTINKQSRDTKRKSDIEQIRSALEMYRSENGYYPNVGSGLFVSASNLDSVLKPSFIPVVPVDPTKTGVYIYEYQSNSLSNGQYYGYCLSATLESQTPTTNTCTPDANQNYGAKNP